jgi:hypothetical protein
MVLTMIDGTISSLLTCHPINDHTNAAQAKEYCTALGGPILTTLRWIAKISHKYEGLITAAFTVVLAVFTGRLWFSTEKLWDATRKLASDAERTAKAQADDTRILQRAYISVNPLGIARFTSGQAFFSCDVGFQNVGNLPARKVRWFIDRMFSDEGV